MARDQNVNLYKGIPAPAVNCGERKTKSKKRMFVMRHALEADKYFLINTNCYRGNIEEFIILSLFYIKISCQVRKNNI